MLNKKLDRREFLKVVVAGAAAAGLSHFRFLNMGGADVVLARECEPGEDPDTCTPGNTDWCIPASMDGGDPDVCAPTDDNPDMCPDDSPGGDGDTCLPGIDPDYCNPNAMPVAEPDMCNPDTNDPDICLGDMPPGDRDVCDPAQNEADVCIGDEEGNGDLCTAPDPDVCEVPYNTDTCLVTGTDTCAPPVDPDICEPELAGVPGAEDSCIPDLQDPDVCNPAASEADVCNPAANEADVCIGDTGGDGDQCVPDDGIADICSPTYDPDLCVTPGIFPPDAPNTVTFNTLKGGISSTISTLGIAATVVGAAAALLHNDEKQKGEIPTEAK